MTFNPKAYALAIAHGDDEDTEKSGRPVTLADHEAAEREARQLLEASLNSGCDDEIPEMSELEGYRDVEAAVCSIQDWGRNIEAEAEGWVRIAQDLLTFKKKKAAA